MVKKGLIDSVLIQKLGGTRIDSGWGVISKNRGTFPEIIEPPELDDEGATGKFDNKGAVFIPGGLILQDSDEEPIKKIPYNFKNGVDSFWGNIKESMRHDNATLLYHDGYASRVNLDNGFINKTAKKITSSKFKPKVLTKKTPRKINSKDISRSYCPLYVEEPDGARTTVSSCISLGLLEPVDFFYKLMEIRPGIGKEEEDEIWEGIRSARQPIKYNGEILAHPHIVVCHSTRYKSEILTGITRIFGHGKFGALATMTLEEVGTNMYDELGITKKEFNPENVAIDYEGRQYALLLKEYPETTPGKRSARTSTTAISPEKDLKLDLGQITLESRERYKI